MILNIQVQFFMQSKSIMVWCLLNMSFYPVILYYTESHFRLCKSKCEWPCEKKHDCAQCVVGVSEGKECELTRSQSLFCLAICDRLMHLKRTIQRVTLMCELSFPVYFTEVDRMASNNNRYRKSFYKIREYFAYATGWCHACGMAHE